MLRTRLLASCATLATLSMSVSMASGTLIAQYNFDGNLNDSSGYVDLLSNPTPDGVFMEGTSSTGSTPGTAVYTNGYDQAAGGALLLDGVNDWVDLGLSGRPFYATNGGLASGTLLAWVRTDYAGNQYLMGTQNTGSATNFTAGNLGGSLDIYPRAENGDFYHIKETDGFGSSLTNNAWHLIAWSWNVDIDGVGWMAPTNSFVWMDGEKAATYGADWQQLDSSDPTATWEFNMALGARDNRGVIQDFWHGAIDTLRIYDHQLTEAELDAIWDAESAALVDLSGDINNDGFVGLDDLDIVLNTWNNGTPPSGGSPSIPEPASLALLATGGIALLRRRMA